MARQSRDRYALDLLTRAVRRWMIYDELAPSLRRAYDNAVKTLKPRRAVRRRKAS